jgi:hypothetical protein
MYNSLLGLVTLSRMKDDSITAVNVVSVMWQCVYSPIVSVSDNVKTI